MTSIAVPPYRHALWKTGAQLLWHAQSGLRLYRIGL